MTSLSGSLFYILFVVSLSVTFGQCTAFSSTLTINEEEGELIWSTLIEGPIRGAPPITPDGTIYVKMHIGPDLPILAFDSNGQQIWHMNEPAGSTESSFKVGSDGTIYLLGGGLFSWPKSILAVNSDGTEKWRIVDERFYSPNFVAIGSNDAVYVSEDNEVFSFSSDGVENWVFELPDTVGANVRIDLNGDLYILGNTELYKLSPEGELLETIAIDKPLGLYAVLTDNAIFSADNDELCKFDLNGSLQWCTQVDANISNSMSIASNNTVYFGTSAGTLYSLDATGCVRWTFDAGQTIGGSPSIGADGVVYIGTFGQTFSQGSLIAVNPDGSERWRYDANQVLGTPTIADDGTIYFGDIDGMLYAVKSSSMGLDQGPWPTAGGNNRNTNQVHYRSSSTPSGSCPSANPDSDEDEASNTDGGGGAMSIIYLIFIFAFVVRCQLRSSKLRSET